MRSMLFRACVLCSLTVVLAQDVLAQQAARIDTVNPTQASSGQVVTITGIGFGARNVRITVGGVQCEVLTATGSQVTFIVPYGLEPGPTEITATNPGGHTGRKAFFIIGGAANAPPSVNAGPDQSIALPNTATLNGSVTDDGLPAGSTLTITWSKISGPGSVTFANANNAATSAAFSAPGTYVLRLSASDTQLSDFDDTTITVDPVNQPPVVNAGPDLTVYLPAVATLNGAVTDDGLPIGSSLTLQWSKLSGPGNVVFSAADTATNSASFSEPGVYVLRLTASDGDLAASDETTIAVFPPNAPPAVNAGPDLQVYLPANATLNGAVTDDGLPPGSLLTIQWSKVSGPGTVTFSNADSAGTTAAFSEEGTYVVRLSAGDTEFVAADDATIVVVAPNQPPVVNAGPDQTVYLPATATLNGSVTDDGLPPGSSLTIAWSKISGPGDVTFSNPGSASTTASFSEPGSYVLRLTANDSEFTTDDDVSIMVNAANRPPVVNAGPDLDLYLPANATLNGSVTDDGLPPGSMLTINWSQLNGPGTVTFSNAGSATTTAAFSEPGLYVLRLAADDSEFTIDDDVSITVHAANLPPVVNAGPDLDVYLPAAATLNGSVTDDGLPPASVLTIIWSKVSGPGSVAFSNANSAVTTASFSDGGSYVLRLAASDSEFTVGDEVTVTVIPANQPPIANAGADFNAGVTTTAQLDGSASTDPDGNPLTFAWTFVSVPAGSVATLSGGATATPSFVVDRSGTYIARLVVNDGLLDSAPDLVTITTVNTPPVANAGADQTATVTAIVTLDATGSSDVDGDTLTYQWTIQSAPASSAIALSDPTAVHPAFVVDLPGTYVLALVVNDGAADSAPDTVVISTVNSAPVANAGPDQTKLVTEAATLNGGASSDVDGDPLTFAWTIVAAPAGSTAALDDPSGVTPSFVVDMPGTYVVQLVVHDGTVPSAADTVTVTTANSAPVADAGADQSTHVGDTVMLDGSGSTDVDGDALTYAWSFVSVPAGSAAVLNDPTAVTPSFVADRPGTYVAQLIVSEPGAVSAPDTVTITTLNTAPVANAGADQTVVAGNTAFLDGSASSDVDGDPLTYLWSLTSVPAGSTAVLQNASTATPSFVVDRVGTFVAQLIVNDGTVNSAPDTVTINTTNSAPIANAGPDQPGVRVGTLVTLDGSSSSDADGHSLSYAWSLIAKPAGSAAVLNDPATASPVFTPDLAGDYVAQLIVHDGFTFSAPDTVLIHAVTAPVVTVAAGDAFAAEIGPDIGAFEFTRAGDSSGELIVHFTIGGTATAGVDYTDFPSTVTFAAGQASRTVVVTPIPDAVVEGAETVAVTLDSSSEYELGLQTSATVTIAGEDLPSMALSLVGSPVVGVGKDVQLQILLSQAAPAGGAAVTVTSDDLGKLTIGPPSTITIAGGGTIGFVTLHGIARGSTTVHAAASGYSDAALDVVVSNNIIAAPITLNVPLGQVTDFPISITREPANNGPVVITVISDNPAAVQVTTPTVVIPAGGLSANAIVFGQSPGFATLTSTAPNFATDTSAVTTTAHLAMVNVNSSATMTNGFPFPITIQLESPIGTAVAAPAGGVSFTFTSGSAACVVGTAPATIVAGTATAAASISYGGTAPLPCSTTVTVTGPAGVTGESATITVNAAPPISVPPSTIGGGLQTGALNIFLGDPNHGDISLHLVSSDPSRVLVAATPLSVGAGSVDIPVANGVTIVNYYLQGMDWVDGTSSASPVTLTASAPGFTSGNGTASYVRPVLDIINLSTSTTSLSANATFVVRVGIPTVSNTMQQLQARRFGAPALVVTASNSNSAVAEIDHTGGLDGSQAQTSSIVPGQSITPNGGVNGFEFDPSGIGTTIVTASIPGFTTLPAGMVTVNVTGPGIFMPATQQVGGGLQQGALQGQLAASQHGGVTVHVSSGDPSRLKIASSATSAGADAIDVAVANGATAFTFYAQAADWVPGTSSAAPVTVTATATGFSNGTSTINYVQPVIDIVNLPLTTTALSANTDFVVRVGVPTVTNAMQVLQARRFGAPPLDITVTNSNAAVAEIDHNGGIDGSQVQTATIAAGQSTTPNGAAGGLEFDPNGVGTTTVIASIPGFITLPSGTQTVTVTGAGISMPVNPAIGGGLQNGFYQGFLGASNHGGVVVHVQSSDPSRILLAVDGTSAGVASLDIPVANGFTGFIFWMQGTDWIEGTSTAQPVTLTASATGFSNGTSTVSYLRPVVDIVNLPASTTALSVNTDFVVRVGVPTAFNSMQTLQQRRFGAPALVVTATNSNGGIAEIDQNGGVNGAQVQTSSIAAGQSTTPNGTADGFEFDPFGTGVTTVSASIPNFLSLPAATVNVTVSTPTIAIPPLANIGGGLMFGAYQGVLAATQHGGVQVHLVSSDPARVLLGATNTSAGAAAIDVPVANGLNTFIFYTIGTDWTDGVSTPATVTVTATASGFTTEAAPITYMRPSLDIGNMASSLPASSANRDINVRIGIPNVGNTGLQLQQWRRPGGSDLTVTLTNTNNLVAEIDLNGGVSGAQTQTATIAAGQSSTPFNAPGGFEFDPIATGSTTLLATIPNFTSLPFGGFVVTITP